MSDAVTFDRVTLGIGGRTLLTDVSFAIARGEFVGVLGPNGVGKTTLLRAILGLVAPRAGRILVGGRPAGADNRAIGYVPQTRAAPVAAQLTGRAFIASALRGERPGLPLTGRAARAEIDRALDRVDARALADRPLAALSGGERQRLLLAQALIGTPDLLLLDEPLQNLDLRHQAGVVAQAAAAQRALGIAVLFSAHDLNPLLPAMDRVLYLGGGRAALGTVDAVITGPVLSALYGAPVDVLRTHGRVLVIGGDA